VVKLWTKKTDSGWSKLWIALVVGAVGTGAGLLFWRRNLQGRAIVGRGSADLRLKASRASNGRKRGLRAAVRSR
jgi:hypothetical protein